MAESADHSDVPDRTKQEEADGENGELSKNAAKKAAKQAKLAADKADKASKAGQKPIGKSEAKQPTGTAPKQAKKKIEGAALIGIDVAKEDDFSGWYQQVLTKGDMLDYYDVSGCYILKVGSPHAGRKQSITAAQPASFFIWEELMTWFNARIKKMGIKNCSFPLFVSEDVLNREKDHIEGFAAEVAWVTHAYALTTVLDLSKLTNL